VHLSVDLEGQEHDDVRQGQHEPLRADPDVRGEELRRHSPGHQVHADGSGHDVKGDADEGAPADGGGAVRVHAAAGDEAPAELPGDGHGDGGARGGEQQQRTASQSGQKHCSDRRHQKSNHPDHNRRLQRPTGLKSKCARSYCCLSSLCSPSLDLHRIFYILKN